MTATTVLRAARVFTGDSEFAPGEIVLHGDRIVRVGPSAQGSAPEVRLGDVTIVAGFVDAHCHGAAGVSFSESPEAVLALHRAHGTTSSIASLVSEPLAQLREQIARLVPLVANGTLAGIHLEGPWLAPAYRGAHAAGHLRDPDPDEVAALLDLGGGAVRMVTLAAERPGGLATVSLLRDRGVVAALGHTGADHATAVAAIGTGVTGATHLFNAMPPLLHRAPGPVLALLADPRVWLEVILDGIHLSTDLVAWLFDICPDRLVLITDAMAATGCGDGPSRIGPLAVDVRDGIARIAGTDTIAGSTLTQDVALRGAVAAGIDWRSAIRALTVQPAQYLGLTDVGVLRPGARADLVALDADWRVVGVWHRGVRTDTGVGSIPPTG